MAAIIKATVQSLRRINELGGDARTENMFLVSSPLPVIAIIFLYLYFVKVWGPKWMANKRPFKLDRVIQVYNILQVLICSYVFYKGYTLFWSNSARSRWVCMPVDNSNTPIGMEKVHISWVYYMLKMLDLMDTIFFVLRKKNNQISFLHVYHHAGMVICGFIAAKYYPGGHKTLLGVINSFVHMVMYTYYLITSINSKYKQNIWWKKHITQLQIVQFFIFCIHDILCLLTKDCPYPKWICAVLTPQNFAMTFLFVEFYRKAYFKKNV